MSTRRIPIRSKGPPAKGMPSLDSARSPKAAINEIVTSSRLQTLKTQPTKGDTVFEAKAFLARVGSGKTILNLKNKETAFAQGDPADAIFYVQKG